MTDGHLWGEASVTYPDMKGSAQLDVSMTRARIEQLVGLDDNEWFVIGLDIGGGETDHVLRVIAIPRNNMPESVDMLPKVAAASGGEIQATEFVIHDVDPYEVLRAISHMFDLRIRLAKLADEDIRVRIVAHGDIPEQEHL